MNKTIVPVSMIAISMLGSCSSDTIEENIIEKPSVEIKDGMLTPEVLEAFGRLQEIAPSPDGSQIAFTLAYESIEENKSNAEIYIINADGSDMTRLTKTASSESSICWYGGENPRIAFINNDTDSGKPQVFSMTPSGEEVEKITSLENGVECFKISPDEKHIIVASPIKPWEKDSTLFAGLDKTTGRLVNDLMYKHWDEWVEEIPHPFLGEFNGKSADNFIDIMEGELYECPMRPFGGAESFAFSPDGKQLVYVSRKLKGKEYAFSTDSNLYLYDIESKTTKNLTPDNPGYDTDPAFSPDGSQLAWLSMATPKYESDKKRLMVMDMKSGSVRDLTDEWKYWPEEIIWAPDGKDIYFAGYYEGTEPIFKINVASKDITQLAEGMWDYNSVHPLADGSMIALRHNMLRPNDIISLSPDGKIAQITDINKEILDQLAEVKVEKHTVKTTDGKDMTAWIILPPDFDPQKQYPGILYCQGGPQQAVSQFWSYRWNFRIMAANGYVVIAPNRRGVPGFGDEWNRQISGDYNGQNMKDYLAAADYLADLPYVDKSHIGAIGASYGGFSVYKLAGI
ncbi:MAG: prolyl oligopeptidase family serine peptidase, partial [Muribaculaceae bacterium]|nr:prolyl oligopeptidase family serine peptidase [Muribaculaceae bacterium]